MNAPNEAVLVSDWLQHAGGAVGFLAQCFLAGEGTAPTGFHPAPDDCTQILHLPEAPFICWSPVDDRLAQGAAMG